VFHAKANKQKQKRNINEGKAKQKRNYTMENEV